MKSDWIIPVWSLSEKSNIGGCKSRNKGGGDAKEAANHVPVNIQRERDLQVLYKALFYLPNSMYRYMPCVN